MNFNTHVLLRILCRKCHLSFEFVLLFCGRSLLLMVLKMLFVLLGLFWRIKVLSTVTWITWLMLLHHLFALIEDSCLCCIKLCTELSCWFLFFILSLLILFLTSSRCHDIAGAITNIMFPWRQKYTFSRVLLGLIILAIDRAYLLNARLWSQRCMTIRTSYTCSAWIIRSISILRRFAWLLSIKIMNSLLSLRSSIILTWRWFTIGWLCA